MRAVVFAYSNVGDRCLRVLRARGVDVPLVVTHRDRPDETIWFERVADTAAELGLPVHHVEDARDPALGAAVEAARPDAIFSFYFRSLIPTEILRLAPRGAFNLHGSLLPKYRGRAPTNWAVLNGETETGATLHEMVEKPDAGAIVDQLAVPILPDDTARQVFDKVTVAAEQILWRSLPKLIDGTAPRLANPIERGSYFGGRKPEDGRIDWSRPAGEVYNLIRAVAPPYPGAFTDVGAARLVIARARLGKVRAEDVRSAARPPGGAEPSRPLLGLRVVSGRIVGVCGDGGTVDVHELLQDGRPVAATSIDTLLADRSAVVP